MRWIAQRAGYHIILAKNFVLFHRDPISAWRRHTISLLRHRVLRGVRCVLPLLNHSGVARDFDARRK
jgi:hypothetical protein